MISKNVLYLTSDIALLCKISSEKTSVIYFSKSEEIDYQFLWKTFNKLKSIIIVINSSFEFSEYKAAISDEKNLAEELFEEKLKRPEIICGNWNRIFSSKKIDRKDYITTLITETVQNSSIRKCLEIAIKSSTNIVGVYSFMQLFATFLDPQKNFININLTYSRNAIYISTSNGNNFIFSRKIKIQNQDDPLEIASKGLSVIVKYINTSLSFIGNPIGIKILNNESKIQLDIKKLIKEKEILEDIKIESFKINNILCDNEECSKSGILEDINIITQIFFSKSYKKSKIITMKNFAINARSFKFYLFHVIRILSGMCCSVAIILIIYQLFLITILKNKINRENQKMINIEKELNLLDQKVRIFGDKKYAIIINEINKKYNLKDKELEILKILSNFSKQNSDKFLITQYDYKCLNYEGDQITHKIDMNFGIYNKYGYFEDLVKTYEAIKTDLQNSLKNYTIISIKFSDLLNKASVKPEFMEYFGNISIEISEKK